MTDEDTLVGKWFVNVKQWKWQYTFFPNHTVKWIDPVAGSKGSGGWKKKGNSIHITWYNSTCTEQWICPIQRLGQRVNYSASYFKGEIEVEKEIISPPLTGAFFWKDRDTGFFGSEIADDGRLLSQKLPYGSSTTVTLRNYSGLSVKLANPALGKLSTWQYNSDDLYIDIIAQMNGVSELQAWDGAGVVTSLPVSVILDRAGAMALDSFSFAYYKIDYRHSGGNLSNYLILEYSDSVVIDINLNDIKDNPMPEDESKSYLKNGRRWPSSCNPATTPRLYAAKQRAHVTMAEHYADFLAVSSSGIFFVLMINPIVAPVTTTAARSVNRTAVPRAVANHVGVDIVPTATPRPRATQGQLRSMLRNPKDIYVWATFDENVASSQTIKFTGETSKGANPRIHLLRGASALRGNKYGPYKVAIDGNKYRISQVPGRAEEFMIAEEIEATEGVWFGKGDIDGL